MINVQVEQISNGFVVRVCAPAVAPAVGYTENSTYAADLSAVNAVLSSVFQANVQTPAAN